MASNTSKYSIEIYTRELNFQEEADRNYLNYIPILNAETITYNEFFTNYLIKNQACVIKNIATKWESTCYWTINGNRPNFEYLQQKYGNSKVMVYDCKTKYYNSQRTSDFTFDDFLNYWRDYIKNDYKTDLPLYYLKDWHLKNANETDNFYEVPHIFASDWLNEHLCENNLDDYRFVYMGPKGSWTPFHADVFTSYSWSVNICGRKRWILFPPGNENKLRDKLNNLPYDLMELCNLFRKFDQNSEEEINKLTSCEKETTINQSQLEYNQQKIPCFEIEQNPGDAIFVPSGWHHQVWNLMDTISINHNWVNSCNLKTMYLSIVENLKKVKNEIRDCADMDNFLEHCQIMLQASYGLDFNQFYDFLKYIAVKRLNKIDNLQDNAHTIKSCAGYDLGLNHCVFDLNAIKIVLELFLQHEDAAFLTWKDTDMTPSELLKKIVNILNKCN